MPHQVDERVVRPHRPSGERPLRATVNIDVVHRGVRVKTGGVGSVLVRQAVGPVVAQRPEVVLGTEGQPHIAVGLEIAEIDKIGSTGHNGGQMRGMAAVDLHCEVLGPVDDRGVAHVLFPPVPSGPSNEMDSGICCVAFRVDRIRNIPVRIIDRDIAVPDTGDGDELSEERESQLRRHEDRIADVARGAGLNEVYLDGNFLAGFVSDVPLCMPQIEISEERVPGGDFRRLARQRAEGFRQHRIHRSLVRRIIIPPVPGCSIPRRGGGIPHPDDPAREYAPGDPHGGIGRLTRNKQGIRGQDRGVRFRIRLEEGEHPDCQAAEDEGNGKS